MEGCIEEQSHDFTEAETPRSEGATVDEHEGTLGSNILGPVTKDKGGIWISEKMPLPINGI